MTAPTTPRDAAPDLQEVFVPEIMKADDAASHGEPSSQPYDVAAVRADFPILQLQVHGKPLVYLDNAATTQKPQVVIDDLVRYYTTTNANIHRGIHFLSQQATAEYEEAREKVQRFFNARHTHEIIFTRGTTEAINLVAATYGRSNVGEGDEVIVSAMEHHSNIVPWQILCEEKGAKLRVVPMNDAGELLLDEFEEMLNERTKLVSIVHLSNSLGTINPVRRIVELAHRHGVPVLLDGAQACSHIPIDVQALDCDFYTMSGHKVYGPTGIGVLYGKTRHLEAMPPYQGGGDMIASVTWEKTTYNELPFKYEAGTPNIAGAISLGVALDYVNSLGLDAIAAHEAQLLKYATDSVADIEGLTLIGTARDKASILAFSLEGSHPSDVGAILDTQGVAIRTGHHCTQPLMDRLKIVATARASFALYNTLEEVDALVRGVHKAIEFLR
jgi:cysteine desulfurase/selenocysteine lyase